MTLGQLLIVFALIAACCGVGKLVIFPRFNPDWVALALAFWFASLLLR